MERSEVMGRRGLAAVVGVPDAASGEGRRNDARSLPAMRKRLRDARNVSDRGISVAGADREDGSPCGDGRARIMAPSPRLATAAAGRTFRWTLRTGDQSRSRTPRELSDPPTCSRTLRRAAFHCASVSSPRERIASSSSSEKPLPPDSPRAFAQRRTRIAARNPHTASTSSPATTTIHDPWTGSAAAGAMANGAPPKRAPPLRPPRGRITPGPRPPAAPASARSTRRWEHRSPRHGR